MASNIRSIPTGTVVNGATKSASVQSGYNISKGDFVYAEKKFMDTLTFFTYSASSSVYNRIQQIYSIRLINNRVALIRVDDNELRVAVVTIDRTTGTYSTPVWRHIITGRSWVSFSDAVVIKDDGTKSVIAGLYTSAGDWADYYWAFITIDGTYVSIYTFSGSEYLRGIFRINDYVALFVYGNRSYTYQFYKITSSNSISELSSTGNRSYPSSNISINLSSTETIIGGDFKVTLNNATNPTSATLTAITQISGTIPSIGTSCKLFGNKAVAYYYNEGVRIYTITDSSSNYISISNSDILGYNPLNGYSINKIVVDFDYINTSTIDLYICAYVYQNSIYNMISYVIRVNISNNTAELIGKPIKSKDSPIKGEFDNNCFCFGCNVDHLWYFTRQDRYSYIRNDRSFDLTIKPSMIDPNAIALEDASGGSTTNVIIG